MASHTHAPICPGCEEKLIQVYSYMQQWFRKIKFLYSTAHVSWGYRDQADQEIAFQAGRSHDHFPNSPHNRTNDQGEPESYAIDLFELTLDGRGKWDPRFFNTLNDYNRQNKEPIIWGGNFKSLGDMDHFQFNPEAET